MGKTEAQGAAIKEKYKEGGINKTSHKRYDTESAGERKESSSYRTKKNKEEENPKMNKDGTKCPHCGNAL